MMPNRPRFEATDQSWEATIPALPWLPHDRSIGAMHIAASGVPASYVARRDYLLDLTVRVLESEWPAFLSFLQWAMEAESFTWYPDANDLDISFEVYLDSPADGGDWSPSRGAFDGIFEAAIVLRNAGLAAPWQAFFPT